MSCARPAIAAIFLLLLASSPLMAEDQPVDIHERADVDENLFVLRAIAHQYNLWPKNSWDGKAALKFAEEGRVEIKYLQSIARKHSLDKDLVQMCDDFFTLMDEYESTLARLGEIDHKAQEQAITDAVAAFVKGAVGGLDAGIKASNKGKNEAQVDVATVQGFADKGLKEYAERSRQHEGQSRNSTAEEQARFGTVLTFAMQRNASAAKAMTARHQWGETEAGFDLPAGAALKVIAERRPRDPFAIVALANEGSDRETDVDGWMKRANMCLAAARLVPGDAAYTGYQIDCLADAALFACNAAGAPLVETYRAAPTAHAQEAVNIVKAYLEIYPQDRDGWGRMMLVRALSDGGRFDEALAAAAPLLDTQWKADPGFSFRYTRLLGVSDHPTACADWLRHCYNLGYSDLNFVKKSQDFDCLRTRTPDVYSELITPRARVHIVFYPFNDDVDILNDSLFPLTNIKLHIQVIQGGKIWQADKVASVIAAKSTGTIANVFSITDSRYDRLRWSITSDQGELKSEE